MTNWSPEQAERIGRACLYAAEALTELGAALVGDTVLARIEAEDQPPPKGSQRTAPAPAPPVECSDPPCGPHHEHWPRPTEATDG